MTTKLILCNHTTMPFRFSEKYEIQLSDYLSEKIKSETQSFLCIWYLVVMGGHIFPTKDLPPKPDWELLQIYW